ncbi:MAG: peptidylprolyl isomerase [Bacteroidetes bacterium]|nr:peptidylprolyl isomerase [Bacteroidota bacterium]
MKQHILIVFLILTLTVPQLRAQDGKALDRVVAVVGDEIITESELQMQILQTLRANPKSEDPSLRTRILDAMMNDKLVLAQAVLDSVQVPPEEVNRRLDEQVKRLTRYYGSEERFEQAVGMTISQMKREYRDDIRKRIMIEMIQQQELGNVEITHREVEEFFRTYGDSLPPVPEQVELRQIVMFPRVTESFKQAAREKAQSILDSIRAGASFEEMAKKYSDDPGSGRNGGNLGLARRGVFVKQFEEAAFALEPGQVSDLVETQFGFHIIKLLEKKGEAIKPQHILIKVEKTGESDQSVIDTLTALRQRILDGASFEEMAMRYSEDPDTRKFGGELGAIEVAELSDELKAVQQELTVGQICAPVKLTMDRDYAYAIVQLEKRIMQHPATLASDYQRIANFAKVFKQNRMYADWIAKIKENVYWKVTE